VVRGRNKASLFVLACGVLGAAAIHRLNHDSWSASSAWPLPPEARRGEWTSAESVPMDPPIRGVWGTGPDDVWAWGPTQIIHWDGRAWARVRPPSPVGGIENMGGAAGAIWLRAQERYSKAPDYWCRVGDGWKICAGSITADTAVDAKALQDLWPAAPGDVQSLAPLPAIAFVAGVRVGPKALWAIDATGTFVGRFDGTRWTIGAARSPALRAGLSGIWFASERDGWAIAGDAILHWDGRMWRPTEKATGELHALGGSASDDVWAVGDRGLTMHWDGESWRQTRPDGEPPLTSLAVRARNDVWAGGCDAGVVVLMHWDGWSWHRRDTAAPYQRRDFAGLCLPLAATGDGQVLAQIDERLLSFETGGPSDPSIRAPERRFDPPAARGAISALAAVDGTQETWALGRPYGERPAFSPGLFAIRHAPGAAPIVRALPGNGKILAVWAHGPDDVWAVGTDGLVLHFDGTFWDRQPIGTDESFVAVHGAGRTVWIAGANGTLLRRRL
jgi:hypothetical protein